MRFHKQLVSHDPETGAWGDCYRTCIAGLMDLHPSEVPPPYANGLIPAEEAMEQMRDFLRGRNCSLLYVAWWADHTPQQWEFPEDMCYILSGDSPNFPGTGHSVIAQGPNRRIVWDPSPSGKGLAGPHTHEGQGYWSYEFIVKNSTSVRLPSIAQVID